MSSPVMDTPEPIDPRLACGRITVCAKQMIGIVGLVEVGAGEVAVVHQVRRA